MAILSTETIRLQATVQDKYDAIRQAGGLLTAAGVVEPDYVEGMIAREGTMSTYLGNGVAIPHGQHANLSQVRRTGISVLQVPDGVVWEDDERAYLIIGIAATSDEHVGILANLAEVIEDEATTQQLIETTDPALIVERLLRPTAEVG
jgi:mannitol/fructose-specific phosphotransferase system IIA component